MHSLNSTSVNRLRRSVLALALLTIGLHGFGQTPSADLAKVQAQADAGDVSAQLEIGVRYAGGDGFPKDGTEAVKWLRLAADQGSVQAQYDLGQLYSGLAGTPTPGVDQDPVEANKWFRLAADKGMDAAQYNLGTSYLEGFGVARDPAEAAKWFKKAADQGYALAQYDLGGLYMSGTGVAKDASESVRLCRLSAEQGFVGAQLDLGRILHVKGASDPQAQKESAQWFLKAAYQGNTIGQRCAGLLYEQGEGVAKNAVESLAWFSLAASSGDESSAQHKHALELQLGLKGQTEAQERSAELMKAIQPTKVPGES